MEASSSNQRGTKQSQSHLSMEEHHINIEGTINERYRNILQSMITYKQDVYPTLRPVNPMSYIYRVHEGLRKVKPEAYEPMVVSIGPYHLQNSKLQAMKEHKLWYLHWLLERIDIRVELYIMELEKLEDKVRMCYNEPIDLTREQFVEMMLLDGCFIIEFFRQNTENPKLIIGWMKRQILDDMMLLENQLPFFLLSTLYDMTKKLNDREEEPLMSLMVKSFVPMIPLPNVNVEFFHRRKIEIKHVLHLVHALCRPLSSTPRILERNIKSQMQSAVELQEAGVKFKKDKSTAYLFDITFEDGVMKVPCFSVEDSTDTFFRNLIAFEQHSMDIVHKYFTDYVDFMVQLISSEKDVKLLRNKRIIVNYLGDDKEVTNLFNKLRDGVSVSYPTHYVDVCKKANQHCNKPRNTMRAYLLRAHGYFDTPFATASTIAAVVLLLLTLLQTIAVFIYK